MVLVTLSSCPNVRFVNVQACTIVGIVAIFLSLWGYYYYWLTDKHEVMI